ncbi:MAG: cytochrome C [Bacteroidetes bacterium]|nr:cytochrome C [Bacteroidota bacterium]MCL5034947.1 cytochrome C [Bacteroidota bacterium]
MKKLLLFGIAGLVALLSISNLYATKDAPRVDNAKLIKFSHKLHINDVGAACTDCHTNVTTSTKETDYLIPNMSVCYTCHDQSSTKCEFCHTSSDSSTYRDLVQTTSPVFFSHKRHAGVLKLKCETCHQGLDKVEYAEQAPNGGLPKMEQCAVCHGQLSNNFRAEKVSHPITTAPGACGACHKDLTQLVPESHKMPDFMTQHKDFVNASGPQNDCRSCHSPTSCQECHDAGNFAKDLTPGQLYVPSTPSLSPVTTHKELTFQKVHPSNFRFTHAIEAKGRESTCYTCHDERTFCVPCHNSEANGARIEPVWHFGGDFVTLGVGSGGGRHAQYARKDIESCASCHDVQGADPVCITCHTDPDGIKGDDPRTHAPFFMRDVNGDWHTNPGSVCYVCHTDPNAHPGGKPGVGFCGYCHGSNPGD